MNEPRVVRVSIVGGGLAALMAYVVLRFRGLKKKEIAIFAPEDSPEKSWENFARAIQLTSLRSESTGHFYPTDSPGLATITAFQKKSLWPILKSWFDQFHPTIEEFIAHTKSIARQTGFAHSLIQTKIGRIERANEHWLGMYDTKNNFLAFAQHVILAVGHGKLHIPEAVAKFFALHSDDERVKLAFENKTYRPNKVVLVLGDGITAAQEWTNVLHSGSTVAALSLHGFSFGQALQVPRKYFSRRGIIPYQRSPHRRAEMQFAIRGTIPYFKMSKNIGFAQGKLVEIREANGKLECKIDFTGQSIHTVTVDQIISATGFEPATTHPLIQQLMKDRQIKTNQNILETDDNCCFANLSTPNSILAVIGPAAAWAIPCADSLGGMKIVARQLANIIIGQESLSPTSLIRQTKRWFQLITGKEIL